MPLEHSAETLAYMAGLFDGKGCVNFTTSGQNKTRVIRVMIRNTDLAIIRHLQSVFGGRIETANHPKQPHWKPSYCWRLDWDAAIQFLEAIEPWVRIKREQILVAQVWDAVRNRGPVRITAEYSDMIGLLVSQMQWLNRKGRRAETDEEPVSECLRTLPVSVDQILAEVGACH